MSYGNLSTPYCYYSLYFSSYIEPKSYVEACKFEYWNQVMQTELTVLEKTGTWVMVDLPLYAKSIGCRWAYKMKYHVDGTLERFKSRIVAKGYNQIEGLDYFATYYSDAKLTTVRAVVALTSINNWHLRQLDVNNVFLH